MPLHHALAAASCRVHAVPSRNRQWPPCIGCGFSQWHVQGSPHLNKHSQHFLFDPSPQAAKLLDRVLVWPLLPCGTEWLVNAEDANAGDSEFLRRTRWCHVPKVGHLFSLYFPGLQKDLLLPDLCSAVSERVHSAGAQPVVAAFMVRKVLAKAGRSSRNTFHTSAGSLLLMTL